MSDQSPLLEIRDLEFAYDPAKPILENISLLVPYSADFGLVGDNGSGKTTLFRCITGLLKTVRPAICFKGRMLETERDFYTLRAKVGLVLQNPEDQLIFPTVLEDLAFGPINLGYNEEMARQLAANALAEVGLKGFENRISWNLSGGEKRLVALAAILSMEPELLLLDEPLNELDEKSAARVREVIASLDCAKIIVSHDRGFLEDSCTDLFALKAGSLSRIDFI